MGGGCDTKMKRIQLSKILSCMLFFLVMASGIRAEDMPDFKIALFVNPLGEEDYQELVVHEITALLAPRYDVDIQVEHFDPHVFDESVANVTRVMNDRSVDCVVGLDLDVSDVLSRHSSYPKPVIAGIILDRRLQGLPMTPDGTSGIDNFNYIQSPFDIEKDIATFKKIFDFKRLAFLYDARESYMFHNVFSYFGRVMERLAPDAKTSLVDIYHDKIEESVADIPPDADSVYLPPVFMGKENDKQRELIRQINLRKLPSFALLGEENVRMGAMASIAPERNVNAMARRIAINLLNIAEGQNAGDLPVRIAKNFDNFVINAETLHQIDCYPSWEALNDARLINLTEMAWGNGPKLDLMGAIREALERNLVLQIERFNTEIQQEQVGLARSSLLPQIGLSTGIDLIDDNRADKAPGSPARSTWSASGEINQSVYSDDIWANYTIQQLLLESEKYAEKSTSFDTIITAAKAYINLLFAVSSQEIQNTNLSVTRKNLDIARNKEAVGAVGASEVHRWESEEAINQIDLNDAYKEVQLARMDLNRVLDRSVRQPLGATDIEIGKSSIELLINDPEVYKYLDNFKRLETFSNFLVAEADRNLPELKEIDATLRSVEREIVNKERAFYLPDFQIQGGIDKIVDEYDVYSDTPSDLDHPWTIAAVATWPLYSGGQRRHDLAQSRIRLKQTTLQEKNLRSELHLRVRSSLEAVAISARAIKLSQISLEAATKNLDIVQAGYSEGRNTVADLIDAQNSKTSSERAAAIAKYQFVLDCLVLERSIGRFQFLDSPEDKTHFLSRLSEYMDTK